MYSKGKANTVPSDAQAREKLALYVYEYLLHVGAQKSAQTFLNEIRWEKNITLGEPPGFLHSWWCVFWDLYCAAPERRDSCDHSSEAKAFHDYSSQPQASPHQPPSHQTPQGYMPNQPPQGYMPNQTPYGMSRYNPATNRPPNVRIPGQGVWQVCQVHSPCYQTPWTQHDNQELTKNYGGMRPPPNSSVAPGVNMPMPGSRPWNPTTSVAGPPGTPIMPSPQDPASTGNDSMYAAMMKSVPGGSMPAYMGGGPDPPLPLGPQEAPLVMNGESIQTLIWMDHCESVAILKIKESMQEEARRFENTDGTTDPQGEFFMQ
ncbi:Single-stranded DNA-binding protein 3 [Acropora cervicornis]|uniref:Single-stranded DNA-binding protein 3 n=1 Tax=Acropora cervicornis TaxID=6130 RepID=A0AAD9QYG3_ACRCE|nr:Single-stranded DNA-binding protein 3 [Acropora cervicornis]